MDEQLYPYVIFLPKDSKQRVLRAIFGSLVPVEIFKISIKQGVSKKIYQKDLIRNLGYSNKTIIERLKMLTQLGILEEHMEKAESGGRTVWLKYYFLSEFGKWFALLLVEEESLTRENKIEIVCSAFRSYLKWIRDLSQNLGMDKENLSKIFREEIKQPNMMSN